MDVETRTSAIVVDNGVMTIEVGVIHGDLWVTSVRGVLGTVVTIGYVGSPDVHTVVGSPVTSRPTHDDVVAELLRDRRTSWQDLCELEGAAPAPF
jgi:hypothetical protein